MYDKVLKNGKFIISENKIKTLLSTEELLSLDPELVNHDLKMAIFIKANNINKDFVLCSNNCGAPISFKIFKRKLIAPNKPACCSKACSTSLTSESRKQKMYDRFGGPENYSKYVSELQISNRFKSGKTGTHQSESRKFAKQTLLDRYGVDHNSKIDSVKESRMVEEEGKLVNIMHTKRSIAKRKKAYASKSSKEKQDRVKRALITFRENNNYNIDYSVLENLDSKIPIEELSEIANCSRMTAYRHLKGAGHMNISYTQDTIMDYVKSLGVEAEETRKIIPPYELDIYIPSKKIAIEYNGLYWHSSGSKDTDKTQSKYHLMKTEMCEKRGIHLFHIFENEWLDPIKKEIWKSMIKHKLGLSKKIHARKCTIKEVNPKDAKKFIEENHLQGFCAGANLYRGLYYEDSLVQLISVGKSRYSNTPYLELLRMCSKVGICVVGGASKLTKGLKLISYGNRRWCSSLGNVYDSIMIKTGESKPCYWYIKNGQIYHRSRFMKHKLNNTLDKFDDKMTEVENCYANGLRRIWDCGNLIYKTKE